MENKEEEIDLLELVKVLWSKRKKIIKYGVIGAVAGLVVGFSLPKVYTSTAVMVPELQSSASKMGGLSSLASLAGVNMAGESIGITEMVYPDIVSSVPFVFEFADMPVTVGEDEEAKEVSLLQYFTEEQKAPWWSAITAAPFKLLGWVMSLVKEEEPEATSINTKALSKEQTDYLEAFNEFISFSVDQKTFMTTLTVNTQSPDISLVLADTVLNKLQEYIAIYKTSKVRSELESNTNMLIEARENYYRADSIYAAASDSKRNIVSSVARISLDRLKNERDLTYNLYSQLASQVELNKAKLNEETPILTVIEPARRPYKHSSPSKALILIAFAFLGGAIVVGIEFVKFIYINKETEEVVE